MSIEIGNSSGKLTVVIFGREHPGAFGHDADWLLARITIAQNAAVVFETSASLRSAEFNSFQRELVRMLSGASLSATYASLEPWLEVAVARRSVDEFRVVVSAVGKTPDRVSGGRSAENAWELELIVGVDAVRSLERQVSGLLDAYPPRSLI